MSEKLKIGIVGCGRFVQNFIPLFQAHPYVASVSLTDLIPERSAAHAEKFGISEIYASFEDMLQSKTVSAVAIFTQRHLHGPLTIAALKAGKHVYSAVPMASKAEEIAEIVDLVRKTGLTFSMGETGHYRPCSIFCRQKLKSGEMGDFAYGESQYNHDMRHFNYKYSGGENWKQVAGVPPMLYPTHSTGMILSATGSWARKVAAFGYVDQVGDDIFGIGKNLWDNPFSNTTALLYLNNGGIARINENRRIGWYGPMSYITSFHGTKGSYESSIAQHTYVRLDGQDAIYEDVGPLLNPYEMQKHQNDPDFGQGVVSNKWCSTFAPVQNQKRLPEAYIGMHDGHGGTHKFMADDFCKAAYTGKLSPTNAWVAARYNLPGLIAHESALRGGETMTVPDLGDSPAGWEVMESDI
jgi:predicted dehydrogenase